jgi:hypothetical protein
LYLCIVCLSCAPCLHRMVQAALGAICWPRPCSLPLPAAPCPPLLRCTWPTFKHVLFVVCPPLPPSNMPPSDMSRVPINSFTHVSPSCRPDLLVICSLVLHQCAACSHQLVRSCILCLTHCRRRPPPIAVLCADCSPALFVWFHQCAAHCPPPLRRCSVVPGRYIGAI